MDKNYFLVGYFCVLALWFLFLGLRGIVMKKPFLISQRCGVAVTCLTLFVFSLLYGLTGHGMLRWFFPPLFVVLFLIAWSRLRAYLAYGVSDVSLKEGLLASLTKLKMTYEETPTGLRLPTVGADLEVKIAKLKMNRREFDSLLGDIVKEMNEFYRSGTVPAVTRHYWIQILLAGVILWLAVCNYLAWPF